MSGGGGDCAGLPDLLGFPLQQQSGGGWEPARRHDGVAVCGAVDFQHDDPHRAGKGGGSDCEGDVGTIGKKYSVSVEGDVTLLKTGLKLKDENGNIFIIESIGMVNYRDRESIHNYKKHAEIILKGDIKKLGKNLEIVEF